MEGVNGSGMSAPQSPFEGNSQSSSSNPCGSSTAVPNKESAFVILMGCPEGLYVGVDYRMWKVGPKFMGVHSIPCGSHYLYWDTSPEGTGIGGFRVGMFVYLEKGHVFVRRWNKSTELFDEVEEDEGLRLADAARDMKLQGHLGPYDMSLFDTWQEVARFVTQDTITRVEPVGKLMMNSRLPVESASNDASGENGERGDSDDADDDETESATGNLFFADIPRVVIPVGASSQKTSELGSDKSNLLDKMIKDEFEDKEYEVLGELQFAYVCFQLGQRWEGFEHWKRLLIFLCNSEKAVSSRPSFYGELIRVVFSQLRQAPDDFFNNELLKDHFLRLAY